MNFPVRLRAKRTQTLLTEEGLYRQTFARSVRVSASGAPLESHPSPWRFQGSKRGRRVELGGPSARAFDLLYLLVFTFTPGRSCRAPHGPARCRSPARATGRPRQTTPQTRQTRNGALQRRNHLNLRPRSTARRQPPTPRSGRLRLLRVRRYRPRRRKTAFASSFFKPEQIFLSHAAATEGR